MKRCVPLLILVLVPMVGAPIRADLFKKTPRPEPATRVPELLYQVKMENNEQKRASAAGELRDFDAGKFPEIVPMLVEVVHHDKSASVRAEAVQSLSKIRPVSALAGEALEHASSKDPAMRVRVQAWTSLRFYRMAGYRPGAKDAQGPQLATQPGKEQIIVVDPRGNPVAPATRGSTKTLSPPPVATDIPRPLPSGPGFSTAIPSQPQRVTVPVVTTPNDGPSIAPPR